MKAVVFKQLVTDLKGEGGKICMMLMSQRNYMVIKTI